MSTAQSNQTQWYGPSSSFYFIGRMSSYLATMLKQPHSYRHMQPNFASKSFASPTSPGRDNNNIDEKTLPPDIPVAEDRLTGTQEDYFLNLFWQSYHCTLQILDETEFREHYRSLWVDSGSSRRPSALVDIVLAICIQYAVTFLPRPEAGVESNADTGSNDAALAGRWLYRRSQKLLAYELESPSITTLQCHIFAAIYLCNASFQNMAHSTFALAVRTAHILGLHLEPLKDMPWSQREFRKRLWWTLFALESKTSMKLGRPWLANINDSTCELPDDNHELVLLSGSNFASPGEGVTWLTYNVHHIKLMLAVRTIYVAFYDRCADILGERELENLYTDHQSLESSAEFLLSSANGLDSWRHKVPDALKTKRKNAGEPFSTDRSALDIEPFAPLWLQRQRLYLELLYHNLAMNLYRPFIRFLLPSTSSHTPNAERNATSCVNHAIAITHILHQIVTETKIFNGWYETFQWQWNATLSIIGFVLGYPHSLLAPLARETINSAIVVLEIFGAGFAAASSAANVTRDLTAKADSLLQLYQTGVPTALPSVDTGDSGTYSTPNQHYNPTSQSQPGITPDLEDESSELFQNALNESMDLAFNIDSFNSLEPFHMDGNGSSDMWNFTLN